jgi:hypothetical protein
MMQSFGIELPHVIVHGLDGDRYVIHGEFTSGQQASSLLLSGFEVDVAALFAVAEDIPQLLTGVRK